VCRLDPHRAIESRARHQRRVRIAIAQPADLIHELAHAFDHADGQLDALVSHEHFARWKSKLHELELSRRIEGRTIVTEVIGDVEVPSYSRPRPSCSSSAHASCTGSMPGCSTPCVRHHGGASLLERRLHAVAGSSRTVASRTHSGTSGASS
jgi:hypothetical protein